MSMDAAIVEALRRAPNLLWLQIDKVGEIVYNLRVGERVQRRRQFYTCGLSWLPLASWPITLGACFHRNLA